MLSAVKDIGKLIIEREGRDLLSILVEDPDSNGSYKKVITIVLEQKDNGFKFAGVETEEYDSGKKNEVFIQKRGCQRCRPFTYRKTQR
ncbi:TM1802 family CRISPR-associated protein [Biomaibacter acetigenes]|uniref:TM1802 family CRISPR-associated protein n=1 Tax=Biomaibacter acetigenes TaxID=2316383 RepID=UPI001CA41D97|nr:TM1802 family CRISPR-associated protein [Biomaibacter acetigenes]